MRIYAFVLACIPAFAAGAQNVTYSFDGIDRQYRIHIPDGLTGSPPVVFALHGYSGNNNEMMNDYGWTQLADERGFVVVFPNGTRDQFNNRFWDVGYDFHQGIETVDDDGFLSSLAVHLQGLYGLDPERTFVTGFSNGAEMCFQLACRESEHFTAFAPVIGMMLDPLFNNCEPTVLRPILSMNGTNDGVTLFDGDPGNTGGWGVYGSIPGMMAFWANVLSTNEFERTFLPDVDPNDGSTVRLDVYSGSGNGLELRYYLVLGGGHDWPGQSGNNDIDATLEVWNFFDSVSVQPCNPGDFTGNRLVDVEDLLAVISDWGNPYNVGDLLLVIEQWGSVCEDPGACCLPDGNCIFTVGSDCEVAGGTWRGAGTSCISAGCPELGACCREDETCDYILSDACVESGGSFRGGGTNCIGTDCSSSDFNDECFDAQVIGNGGTGVSTADATDSTDLYSDVQCGGSYLGQMHADIWFSYQATCSGMLSVSTCNDASFDTDLVVYSGTCSDKLQIACSGDDDNCADYTSQLDVEVVSGEWYLIRVGGWENGNSGTGSLLIDCEDDQ